MLVVVHHRNVQLGFQTLFDFETFRSLNVFQVDTSKCGGNSFDRLNETVGIFLIHLNVKYVDTGENLKKQTFSLHDRLACQRTDVA